MSSFLDLPTALALSSTPANTTVLHGTTLELNCKADANPDAHLFHFQFNGNLIGNSSTGVFNSSAEKDGVYTCVPVNTVGTGDNATISITVVGGYDNRQMKLVVELIITIDFLDNKQVNNIINPTLSSVNNYHYLC